MDDLDVVDGEVGSLIRRSVAAVADRCPSRRGDPGTSHVTCWSRLAELGFTDLRWDDAASTADALIVVEEMAAAVCGAPVLFGALLVPQLLRSAALGDSEVLALARSGRLGLAMRPDLHTVADGDRECVCVSASALTHALTLSGNEVGLVALGPGTTTVDLSSDARSPAGAVRGLGRVADDGLVRFHTLCLLGVAADALGAGRRLLTDAVEHSRTRVQFGRPIGAFQAVQHLCADSYWQLDALRSAVLYGAWALDKGMTEEASETALAAKAFSCRAAFDAVVNSMQIFGGMSITWEHHAHYHLRRVLLDRELFGNADSSARAMHAHSMAVSDGLR